MGRQALQDPVARYIEQLRQRDLTPRFRVRVDPAGGYYWVLEGRNGLVLARSAETFAQRETCEDSIALVRSEAADAEIVLDLSSDPS